MTPFSARTHGPEWFAQPFLATGEQEVESKQIWKAFLTPKLNSTRIGTSREIVNILSDNATVEGETAETIHEPILVEDSSLEPLPQKKKPGNIGADTRKIPSSPKVTPTPK
ncbi:hypothetical protein KIW84_075319 [Lathyrus oleraceus]|uniref:Uncharacterized protein n=1 Tax=Pisum sativum TaxID=3888 RepID=A0A9D4VTM7_PEA|nr:hypothetical protein KIW84_075319 [Pisum sativum]